MASLRNIVVAILRAADWDNLAEATRHHARDLNRPIRTLPPGMTLLLDILRVIEVGIHHFNDSERILVLAKMLIQPCEGKIDPNLSRPSIILYIYLIQKPGNLRSLVTQEESGLFNRRRKF